MENPVPTGSARAPNAVHGRSRISLEIQDGAWHVCDVDFELIFNDKPSSIIEELSKKVGYNIKSIINQNKVQ